MATPPNIAKLAALLSADAKHMGPEGIVAPADVKKAIADGWDPTDPQQLLAGFTTGKGLEWCEGHPDPAPEFEWVLTGEDDTMYRVPVAVAKELWALKCEAQEAKRRQVAALVEHRAELRAALGTPEPNVDGLPPGSDAPPMA